MLRINQCPNRVAYVHFLGPWSCPGGRYALGPYTNFVPWAGVSPNWPSIGPNRNPVRKSLLRSKLFYFDKKREFSTYTNVYLLYNNMRHISGRHKITDDEHQSWGLSWKPFYQKSQKEKLKRIFQFF